jgi:hypothetical protein
MGLQVRWLAFTLFAVATNVATRPVAAQQQVSVRGHVRDSASGRPLGGAIVAFGANGAERITRTDDAGDFAFTKVAVGSYPLTVRRLGYEPVARVIDVREGMDSIAIAMNRVSTLDTVRIRATSQGISGVVGTSSDLRPLPSAKVQVLGGSGKDLGRFDRPFLYPDQNAGLVHAPRHVARVRNANDVGHAPPRRRGRDRHAARQRDDPSVESLGRCVRRHGRPDDRASEFERDRLRVGAQGERLQRGRRRAAPIAVVHQSSHSVRGDGVQRRDSLDRDLA